MGNVEKQQQDFLKSYQGEKGFEKAIKVNGLSPEERLRVYHNSIKGSLARILSVTYPLTWQLIGEDCAEGAAHAFLDGQRTLPLQASYENWTKGFADFLEDYPQTKKLSYLPDFVRLEWFMFQAYGVEDKGVLKGTDFAALDPAQFDKLVLEMHPAAHLFSSDHSLDQVLDVVREEKETATLEKKTVYGVITRPSMIVDVVWTSKENYDFLSLIAQGGTLVENLEKVESADFDFQGFLGFALKNGIFSEIKMLS